MGAAHFVSRYENTLKIANVRETWEIETIERVLGPVYALIKERPLTFSSIKFAFRTLWMREGTSGTPEALKSSL